MTPKGFRAWVSKATTGRKIIYFEGKHLQETVKVIAMRNAAMAAYEAGDVLLTQKRITPQAGITKRTKGTFAYVATRI